MKTGLKYLFVVLLVVAGSRAAQASGVKSCLTFDEGSTTPTGTAVTSSGYVAASGTGDLSNARSQAAYFSPGFDFSAGSSSPSNSIVMKTAVSSTQLTLAMSSYTVTMAGGAPVFTYMGTPAVFSTGSTGSLASTSSLPQVKLIYSNLAGGRFTSNFVLTPEPSSLLLLGTGLVSAAGIMLRKRRAVTAV